MSLLKDVNKYYLKTNFADYHLIKGANYESDASELNIESVEPMLTDISESSNMELKTKGSRQSLA